jgi:Uma2 family endonuclease
MAVRRRLTTAEFLEQVQRRDDRDRLVELVNGEIVEMPSNPYASALAARLIWRLRSCLPPM